MSAPEHKKSSSWQTVQSGDPFHRLEVPRSAMLFAVICWLSFACSFTSARANAEAPAEGVYIILDASGSMWGQLSDGTHKIRAAKDVLRTFVTQDFAGKSLALRAYGHHREGDCADTELVVPFMSAEKARGAIEAFADHVNPKGKTPISRSLRAALEDFGERRGEVILISDGIETCDEDPCELIKAWREKDVAIRIHVVGLGLNEKEKAAMQCLSTAAGTEYQDARSADELAAGLAKIQELSGWRSLVVRATTAAGEELAVHGTAMTEGGESIDIASHRHNAISPGKTGVTVGVRMQNGSLYKPVSKEVEVAERGETMLEVVVEEPPSVTAKFIERGEERRGSQVKAYQDGAEVFSFRWLDRTYVEPGTYEFRARPNADNELSVTATIADGEHRELVFELLPTVHAMIRLVASGSGIDFRQNYELWQDGKKARGVHWGNGVRVTPGTYDLHLLNPLTHYVHTGLVLTEEPKQTFRIEVPVGHVTIVYQLTDGSRDRDDRCRVERFDGERWIGHRNQRSGEPIPLTPGRYRVKGWDHKGDYDPMEFVVAVGDEKEVVLKNKR